MLQQLKENQLVLIEISNKPRAFTSLLQTAWVTLGDEHASSLPHLTVIAVPYSPFRAILHALNVWDSSASPASCCILEMFPRWSRLSPLPCSYNNDTFVNIFRVVRETSRGGLLFLPFNSQILVRLNWAHCIILLLGPRGISRASLEKILLKKPLGEAATVFRFPHLRRRILDR